MPTPRAGRTLQQRLWSSVKHNWSLGFTAFGGPPVHFKIFHTLYVEKLQWVDEQIYQELFSVSQALSGPASTKMHYCINLLHDGFLPAVLSFFLWSLPGALGMLGLGLGVASVGDALPRPVYALLSGLNAATVGIIVLAAVQLSERAITNKTTRLLVFGGGAAGLLYNALWYFPLLMLVGGVVAVAHDLRWLHGSFAAAVRVIKRISGRGSGEPRPVEMRDGVDAQGVRRDDYTANHDVVSDETTAARELPTQEDDGSAARVVPASHQLSMSWRVGLGIILAFLASFVVVIVLRGTSAAAQSSLAFRFFANMYLAGTIIFGGGPVVIPLLREYVVAEGWVRPRDFLIGLAVQQSFPGPNFNFAVYLGALVLRERPALGAALGFAGIFAPGLVMVHGTMGVWGAVRGSPGVKSFLKGLNAVAVGLIYTAVYRIWQIGYIDEGFQQGTSLAVEPWWVVVTATSYVGGYWFGMNPPTAILLGCVMGLIWYAIVSS
ncbi:chromate ion transporter [Cordyceps fumosorosea ARSEF 2679]|uniref:Chromate ion transporter n=1 Tax=Cordyceps fumosorosea (strain ARSEF 2679) TaxID=1081104 RepID=A0A168D8U9_CORFA|nr:chromate ion transporter [Cordyceps fumosorosea ARSEF 2679]OAA72301.1 chromate ion transporter [Cordyceps fumosorosea ARSEF 2679]